jgi:hypothetical protein
MLTVAERKLFRPNAVYVPIQDGKEGRDFDREDCTLLFVDGEYAYGEVYTEEEWKDGGSPSYVQRRGDFFLLDGSEVVEGRVQLLPDVCVVKIPEWEWWSEDVQAMTKRLFGVYALDRRQHFHLCELCASYELWFVEPQYEETDEVAGDEHLRDELYQIVTGAYEEPVTYVHRKEIDPMFLRGRRCRPGFLPEGERAGGYRLRGLRSVTWDGVMEEIFALTANSAV